MALPPSAGPFCLLIADDLTGACDAAAPFAARGYPTTVRMCSGADLQVCPSGRQAGASDVLSLTTETRNRDPLAVRSEFRDLAARRSAAPSQILFKKIDSTLRGNAGLEIALAAEAFRCATVLITPAFPAMGRLVEHGVLRVADGAFDPIDMSAYWRGQSMADCMHVGTYNVATAIATGCRFISVDAASDSDLDAIVAVGLASPRPVLWAGSAGLAKALARSLSPGPSNHLDPPSRPSAALFCLGSEHAVTLAQQQTLAAARSAAVIEAASASPDAVADSLARNTHVILRIQYGLTTPERIRILIGTTRPPLVLSGGDTASLVCRALAADEIHLSGELAAGIPFGSLAGGPFDEIPVVTKAGGFGAPDALIQIADYFACPQ